MDYGNVLVDFSKKPLDFKSKFNDSNSTYEIEIFQDDYVLSNILLYLDEETKMVDSIKAHLYRIYTDTTLPKTVIILNYMFNFGKEYKRISLSNDYDLFNESDPNTYVNLDISNPNYNKYISIREDKNLLLLQDFIGESYSRLEEVTKKIVKNFLV